MRVTQVCHSFHSSHGDLARTRTPKALLNADLTCEWDATTSVLTVNTRQADIRPLHLTASDWLGQDSLRWESLQVGGAGVLGNGRFRFQQVEVACDAGKFTLNGEIPWRPAATGAAWAGLLASAAAANVQLDGRIDLAILARTFPQLLTDSGGSHGGIR